MSELAVDSPSDAVREYVREKYLRPARQRGERTFSVNVGAVHKALDFQNRVPLVCQALKSKKFLNENSLKLLSISGPPSGQSTTVTLTYEILRLEEQETPAVGGLTAARGIAASVFRSLGGGEAFIRQERRSFSDRWR